MANIERETNEFIFYRDNNGNPSYTYKYREEFNTLMNDFRESALYRYIHKSGITYPEKWYNELSLDEITDNMIYEVYPNLPNIDYELLRTWWGLYKPLAEDILYEEWEEMGDEPSDRDLLRALILSHDI